MTRIAIEPVPVSLRDLLAEAVERLRAAARHLPDSSPELDAELLLAAVLRVPRAHVYAHPEQRPDAHAVRRFQALIARRADGEPVAYLLGRKGFWTLELEVNPAVLVPRPETELLVERALVLRPEPYGRVADLGTGSGALALALAAERPGWHIVATDVSPEALAVARGNAVALGFEHVTLCRGSWCAALPAGAFDILLSNPPYICSHDEALGALHYEPTLALTPGPDALSCLREIIHEAPGHLAPGGWLVLEHGAAQGPAVAAELTGRGFVTVRTHRDLAGRERMTEGQWPTIR